MVKQGGDEESGLVASNHSSVRSDRSSPPPSIQLADPIQASSSSHDDRPPTKSGSRHVSFVPGPQIKGVELDVENPEEWVWEKYGQYLVTKVAPWAFNRENEGESSFDVNLAEVQRMYLVQLRIRLARHIARWEKSSGKENLGISSKSGEDGAEGSWEDDLHRYVQGLQDYDYMDKCSQNLSIDPFRMSGERKFDRTILNESLRGIDDTRMGKPLEVRRWDGNIRPIIRSRTDNRYKRLFGRIIVSAVGAGFLIGPMWLMMLETGLYVALISTSAFVAVFGIIMACVLDEHINVLSSTAAYAAVLVVFVGLRGESTTA